MTAVIDEIVNGPNCDQLHHGVGGEVLFATEHAVVGTACGAPLVAWSGHQHCEARPIRGPDELERVMERRRQRPARERG